MLRNPFTPIFGGKPDTFFGREDILHRFDLALADADSESRYLFLTGTYGIGKTALLEQLSRRASRREWYAIDLGPDDTVLQLLHTLDKYGKVTTGLSGSSMVRTTHFGREELQPLLLSACKHTERGILVTIDEIQKVPIDDASAISNAFQMASRKGYDILLVVAGLPFAYELITNHEGCTFLRRGSHEEVGLFTWEEADVAFHDAFSRVSDITISQEAIDTLNEESKGQPYLMQLLGYYLVREIGAQTSKPVEVTAECVEHVIRLAHTAYERRALRPLLSELSALEMSYLRAMSSALNEDRIASTAAISEQLQKTPQQLSKTRGHLIDLGYIASVGYGKLVFCIPYLADYVTKPIESTGNLEVIRQRRV